MSPRWATTGIFFVNGACIGTWVANIPWIQDRFDLSKSTIGLLLVGMSLAVVCMFPVAGQLIARHGSERMVAIGGVACALAVSLPLLAPHPVLIVVGLAALGLSSATMDVSMNSHGVHVEGLLGKPIMSSLHAGWSFGGMIGAAFAALLAAAGLDPRVAALMASGLLLGIVCACLRSIGAGSHAHGEETPRFSLPPRGVVVIAVVCLLVMVTEGAMADWGGLFLRQNAGSGAALAASAFAFFTAGMTTGRVFGDWINHRIGPVALLRYGALLTGIPLALMLLVAAPAPTLVALFLIGLGVSNGVPLMFSAAGSQPGIPSGPGIAAVSSMGSLGFLAGPPAIGFLADAVSLPWALALLVLAAGVVFALARRAAGRRVAAPSRGGEFVAPAA
jgi:MFS family permease